MDWLLFAILVVGISGGGIAVGLSLRRRLARPGERRVVADDSGDGTSSMMAVDVMDDEQVGANGGDGGGGNGGGGNGGGGD